MRKPSHVLELNTTTKNKRQQQQQQQMPLKRESPVVVFEHKSAPSNGTVEDALVWVENNLPTSLADQALQTLTNDGDGNVNDAIVDTRLERSKMQ
jgi:hypothetical protein